LFRFLFITLGASIILLSILLVPINLLIAGKMGDLKVGPLPKGTPINLLASINPYANPLDVVSAFWKLAKVSRKIDHDNLSDEAATRLFDGEVGPALLKISKSPDWVEDRGHYFAAGLSDEDKRALKEFLKTF
jgi:hypothetical protein